MDDAAATAEKASQMKADKKARSSKHR